MKAKRICGIICVIGLFSFVTGSRIKDFLTCPDEFENIHRSCFRFVNEKKTWQEAQDYCRGLDSDLAALEAYQEKEAVNGVIEDKYSGDTKFWFGYRRRLQKGRGRSRGRKDNIWEWLPNHEEVDDRVIPWLRTAYKKKPSSYCGGIQFMQEPPKRSRSTLVLHNDGCSKKRFFVCEHKPLRRFGQTAAGTSIESVTPLATRLQETTTEIQDTSTALSSTHPQESIVRTKDESAELSSDVKQTNSPTFNLRTTDESKDEVSTSRETNNVTTTNFPGAVHHIPPTTSVTRPQHLQQTIEKAQNVPVIATEGSSPLPSQKDGSATQTTLREKPFSSPNAASTLIKTDMEKTLDVEQSGDSYIEVEKVGPSQRVVAPCQGFGGSAGDSDLYRSYLRSSIHVNEVKAQYYSEISKIYAKAIEVQTVYYANLQAKLELELAAAKK